ncbi:MAG: glycosyltransferase [bacterium]
MKIGFANHVKALDIHSFSGCSYYLFKALENSGLEMLALGHISKKYRIFTWLKKIYYRLIFSENYQWDRELWLLKIYAARVAKELSEKNCDVVVSVGCQSIAYLKTDKPIIYISDATFAGMVDFYPGFSNLCAETLKNGNEAEQRALANADLSIFSSEWAANSAKQNYEVDPDKVKVVPFGANVNGDRDETTIRKMIEGRDLSVLKLLFVGIDWLRKDGDTAIKVAKLMNARCIPTELHVAGCRPKRKTPAFVKHHGFISKGTEAGVKKIEALFAESHFLILPSRAECCGVVFAEANSFGLPCLATNVGGITTAIRNGVNGQTFPLNENEERYCDFISDAISTPQKYESLCLSSFHEYTSRINWESFGKQANALIQDLYVSRG